MSTATAGSPLSSWRGFVQAPRRVRVYLAIVAVAALVLPLLLGDVATGVSDQLPGWLTAAALVALSVLNVEISRRLSRGLSRTHQPHKALSAWAFACALLLAAPWLLVVVGATYAHAWWRGLRLPLWKWAGSACFVVLAALAAALVRTAAPTGLDAWARSDGTALLTLLAAAGSFLAVESLLFAGSAWLGRAEDEAWLRRTLLSPSFYGTELGVLLLAGLMAAIWTVGPWFTVFLVPLYLLVQRAALHDPLRERAEAAAALGRKNQELEAANQLKVDLLGMMGHELGNPLTSVTGYAQVGLQALHDGDDELARHAGEAVERNAARLRNVLHDILALVSNDLGALTAHVEECPLRPHLVAATQLRPAENGPRVDCPEALYALVQPGHLDQILANLLTNAEKYAGGASRVTAHRAAGGVVEIAVVDAGPGVPEEFRCRLFERFSRARDTSRSSPGTGLGLFITRELARANGGDVELRSPAEGGATFVLTLPALERTPTTPTDPEPWYAAAPGSTAVSRAGSVPPG